MTEGDRVVSVRMIPSGGSMGVYVAPAIYEARRRKADGVLTWRCVNGAPLGTFYARDGRMRAKGYRSERRALAAAAAIAAAQGIRVVRGVSHGRTVCL